MGDTAAIPTPDRRATRRSINDPDEGRRRTRRVISGIATALISRGAAALAPLLLIPITLNYLGKEVYGLWMAVTAVTAMLHWADLGLGNGLMTKLTSSYAQNDVAASRRYVSTSYAILTATAVALLGLVLVLAPHVPWALVFNVADPQAQDSALAIVIVCLSAMFLNIPLSLVQRVQYATQRVAQGNIWQAAGSVASVALAATAVAADVTPVLVIAAAVSGPLVVNAVQTFVVYAHRHAAISPRPRFVDSGLARPLLALGGQFLVISILTSISLNADNLIIARTLGASAVTDYAIPYRVFAALGLIVTLVNLPLWPANGEALARGDTAWVRKITRRVTLFSGAAVLLPSIALVLFGEPLIQLWTGTQMSAPVPLLLGLVSWWLLLSVTSPMFMVQNAAGVLRPQMVGWAAFLLLSLPAKYVAVQHLGLPAIPSTGTVLYIACVWTSARLGYRRALRSDNQLDTAK